MIFHLQIFILQIAGYKCISVFVLTFHNLEFDNIQGREFIFLQPWIIFRTLKYGIQLGSWKTFPKPSPIVHSTYFSFKFVRPVHHPVNNCTTTNCDKIFLLVSRYLSLWPWPSFGHLWNRPLSGYLCFTNKSCSFCFRKFCQYLERMKTLS